MNSNYTVLIQGPLEQTSIDHIPNYLGVGPVMLSYWLPQNLTLPSGISFIGKEFIGTTNYSQPTADRQFWGVYNGLLEIKTPYTIRTRSDEFWNLAPLIESYNGNGVLCGNIFFRPFSACQYHPGDHVFIGRTDFLLEVYRRLCYEPKYCVGPAEVALAKTAMDVLELSHSKESFLKIFNVIDINNLKTFRACYRSAGFIYENNYVDTSVIKDISGL